MVYICNSLRILTDGRTSVLKESVFEKKKNREKLKDFTHPYARYSPYSSMNSLYCLFKHMTPATFFLKIFNNEISRQ